MTRNAIALYAVQIAGYIAPIVTLPILARALGPEEYGRVAFAHSFALWMSLIIEYGFNLSATRDVARCRNQEDALARLVAGVLGAKGLLAAVALVISLGALGLVPVFRDRPVYLLGVWLLAVANGMTPFWYFQGVERVGGAAAINVSARLAGIAALVATVRSPLDGWKVLLIYAATTFLAHGVNYALLYRDVVFRYPRFEDVARGLRDGLATFVMQLPGSVLSVANTFVLGLIASPVVVAHYSGADRLVRPLLSLLWPLTQALFPHISAALAERPELARRTVVKSLAYTVISAGAGGAMLIVAAPLVVKTLLGAEFEASVSVLRVLGALLPINAAINVLGYQWLIPLGRERAMAAVYVVAMLVNLIAAFLTVPRIGAIGMAWSVVGAEFVVLLGVAAAVRRAGQGRWLGEPS